MWKEVQSFQTLSRYYCPSTFPDRQPGSSSDPIFVGFYGGIRTWAWLLIDHWLLSQPPTPVSSPEVRAAGTKWARSMGEDQKYTRNAFSSKWPICFSYKSQYYNLYLCPGRFFSRNMENHSAHTQGRLEWSGGNGDRVNPEDQPSTHDGWKLAQMCPCSCASGGHHYEPCFIAFLSGLSFHLPLASYCTFYLLHSF